MDVVLCCIKKSQNHRIENLNFVSRQCPSTASRHQTKHQSRVAFARTSPTAAIGDQYSARILLHKPTMMGYHIYVGVFCSRCVLKSLFKISSFFGSNSIRIPFSLNSDELRRILKSHDKKSSRIH